MAQEEMKDTDLPSMGIETQGMDRDTEREEVKGLEGEEEVEYVLLDLEEVFHGAALPPDCPYSLTGLDTMNPVLTLGDNGLKLIGEYEDTVGTCLVFTEHDEDEGGSSQAASVPRQKKGIKSLCGLEKKLKFRVMDSTEKPRENL